MTGVDINSDVGEGIDNETQLMPLLSSCNIACGAHAGDLVTMQKVVRLAQEHNVKIGAHPGYEDKANFGRVVINCSSEQLQESIKNQIHALREITIAQGATLHHIKPHGALYNKAAYDPLTAQIIVHTIASIDDSLVLYAPYNAVILEMARGILPVKIEGFADRNYNEDYTLVSRTQNNALITSPEAVMKHITTMIKGNLHSVSGEIRPIKLDTICVHGDTEGALEILRYIHQNAQKYQIHIL